jgi:hypothetical protein
VLGNYALCLDITLHNFKLISEYGTRVELVKWNTITCRHFDSYIIATGSSISRGCAEKFVVGYVWHLITPKVEFEIGVER